jgi:uncharacterized protein
VILALEDDVAHIEEDPGLGVARAIVLLYVAAIIGAEAIASAVGPVAGAVWDAILLYAMLNSCVVAPDRSESRLFPFLALVPLLRLLSLTMPSRHVAEIWWYAMVGAPLLLGAFLAARAVPIAWPGLRLRKRAIPIQTAIALAGVPLSLAAYEILEPAPLVSPLTAPSLVGASLILIVFSAFTEEVVFRGLLQGAAREFFGLLGLVIVSVLYASLYIGSMSAAYVGFTGVVGLALAVAVDRTGVLWGAVGAHAFLNIGLLLVWPTVQG